MQKVANQGKLMYMAVGDAILDQIASGDLKPGDRLDRPQQLARQMKVGEGTVRHALQSLAARGFVERRPRVGTIVARVPEEHHATSSPSATQTAYALIVPDIRNPQFSCLARGVQDAAAKQHIDVITCNTDDDPEVYESIISRCLQNRIGGLIMVPPLNRVLPLRVLADLQEAKIPVVTCWRPIDAAGWPLVRGDSFENARTVLKHLVERGYQKIGLIASTVAHDASALRAEHAVINPSDQILTNGVNGYYRGLQDAGRRIDEALILCADFDRHVIPSGNLSQHPAVDRFAAWVEAHPEMDAVFCVHDFLAALLMHALERLGKRTPEDVGVVGAGNIASYHSAFPCTLTTLDGHFGKIGESACRLLAEMRNGQSFPPGYTHVIPARLVVGHSTDKPQV